MRKTGFVWMGLTLGLLGLAGCVTTEPIPPLTGPAADALATRFTLPRFPDGATYDLASDRGHVVLLDVWATWCEPCKDALPIWQDIQKEYGARGLKVYAINVEQDRNHIERFLRETKLELPVLWDPDGLVVGPILKVRMMPTTFLVDRRGVVRFIHEGFAEEHLAQYQSQIEQLLKERP